MTSTGDIIEELDLVNDPQLAAGVYNRRPRLRPAPGTDQWNGEVYVYPSDLGYDPDGDDLELKIPSFPPPKYISPTYDEIVYETWVSSAGDTVSYTMIDSFGDSSDVGELFIRPLGGSISAPWGSDISFHTNPVTITLEINYPESIQMNTVEILNAAGQLVGSDSAGPFSTSVNMKPLPPGMYLIRMTDTD